MISIFSIPQSLINGLPGSRGLRIKMRIANLENEVIIGLGLTMES